MTDQFKDGTGAASSFQVLLEQIRQDMGRNSNQRRSLRESRREARARESRSRSYSLDPGAWQRQFDELVSAGIDDLTIGYWRVSTQKQEEAEGPESQQQAVIAYALANTERGIDLWIYDVDSGKEESRIGLDFLSRAIGSGKVKRVIVQRLDRIARNNFLAETFNREAFLAKVQICSATEHIPDGPVGHLIRQILQALAQYEAAVIVSRMNEGKRVRVRREGTYNGGEVPYGYLATGKGYMVVCDPEARIVRLVFELYDRGFSQTAIADALNRWGIPTRQRGMLGWRQGQIRRILLHEAAYRAEALFSRTISESERIAHHPILEHRDESIRTYVFGTRELRPRLAVPDDLLFDGAAVAHIPGTFNVLTADQALSLQMLYKLRDTGHTLKAVAAELNRLGLKTLSGRQWRGSNVQQYVYRREVYAPAIAAAGISEPDVPGYADPALAEERAVQLIQELRNQGKSHHAIQARLLEAGIKTARGAVWSISSINRVLRGQTRTALKASAGGG